MLQILQTRHIENYSELINKLGLDSCAVNVVEATENDCVIGTGIYYPDFDRNCVVIRFATYGDLLLLDGIIRSILFLAMLRGIEKAEYEFSDDSLLNDCKKLGLCDESGKLDKISDVLDGCASCKHNKNNE